jgi:hypothetical protein
MDRVLGTHRFAREYVMNEELSDAALGVVERAGGRLSVALRSAIGQALHAADGPRPTWLAPWRVLLVENAPERAVEWLVRTREVAVAR